MISLSTSGLLPPSVHIPWRPEDITASLRDARGAKPELLLSYLRSMAIFLDGMYNDVAAAIARANYNALIALGDKGDATILSGQSSIVVASTTIATTSRVFLFPVTANATAAFGSAKHPYVSARVAGTSFTVSTGDGSNVAADVKFDYWVVAR